MSKRKIQYQESPKVLSKPGKKWVLCSKCEKNHLEVSDDAHGGVCWICCQMASVPEKLLKEKEKNKSKLSKNGKRLGRPPGAKTKKKTKTAFQKAKEADKKVQKLAKKHKRKKKTGTK